MLGFIQGKTDFKTFGKKWLQYIGEQTKFLSENVTETIKIEKDSNWGNSKEGERRDLILEN